mgnify:CR=1 FL=1
MKRLALLGIALSISMSLFVGQASAATTYETEVLYGVNFRSEPSTSSTIYRMLRKGENIHVIEQVNAYWLKVEDKNGKVGYISASSKYTDYKKRPNSSDEGNDSENNKAPNKAPAKETNASTKASAIIATAKSYLGDFKYKFGAEPWNTNYRYSDCSAFVQLVFNKHHGYNLPRVSRDQAKVGTYVSKANLQPGDLVFFDTNNDGKINHVGIYLGNGEFIHSAPSNNVGINNLNTSFWKNHYETARRVL